jgi:hypothetical protein
MYLQPHLFSPIALISPEIAMPAWWRGTLGPCRVRPPVAPPRFRPDLIELEQRILPSAEAVSAYGQLPLSFEANQGQASAGLDYITSGAGYGIGLSPTAAWLALHSSGDTDTALAMRLLGSNPAAPASAQDPLPGVANYFVGNDPSQWRTNIATFGQVVYSEVYPGINVVYYGTQHQLEYDFVVAPGANPNAIRLQFDGADSLSLDAAGNLLVHSCGGDLASGTCAGAIPGWAGRTAGGGGRLCAGRRRPGAFPGGRLRP